MISPTSNKSLAYQPLKNKAQSSNFSTLYANAVSEKRSGTKIDQVTSIVPNQEEDTIEFGHVQTVHMNYAEPIKCKASDPTYPDSIYKLSPSELEAALMGAADACEYLNKEGMTQAEIYNAFESIYIDYLGKDFMEPQLTKSRNGGTDCLAFQNFHSGLRRHGVDVHNNPEILLEARGYTGMSESDIRAAVRGKYPDQMSLRETLAMSHELSLLGFDKGARWNAIMTIYSMMGGRSSTSEKVFDAMLDLPADYDTMKASYDAFVKNDRYIDTAYDMNAAIKKLIAWVGGSPTASDKILSMLKDMAEDKNSLMS